MFVPSLALGFLWVQIEHVFSYGQADTLAYLPFISVPHCTSHDVYLTSKAPSQVNVGEFFTVALTLHNQGCTDAVKPKFLQRQSSNLPSSPHNPPRVPITITNGESVGFVFTFFAQEDSPPSVNVGGAARFFVFYAEDEYEYVSVSSPLSPVVIKR